MSVADHAGQGQDGSASRDPLVAIPTLKGDARRGLRLEHIVMALGVALLAILVVLPLGTLMKSSIWGEDSPTLEHFREALEGRLYLTALWNSLVLGFWTGLFSVVIGVPLAWAVSRTD